MKKETLMYSSDVTDYYKSEEELISNAREYNDDWEDFSDEEVLEFTQEDHAEFAWSDFKENLPTVNGIVVKGDIGRWNGRSEGYLYCEDWESVFKQLNFGIYDYLKVKKIGVDMVFIGSHHDGTDYISLRKLNNAGRRFYENNINRSHSHGVLKKLFDSKRYSTGMYGWGKQ